MENDMLKIKAELRVQMIAHVKACLNQCTPDELKEIYSLVSLDILNNADFCAVREAGMPGGMLSAVEAETGNPVVFDAGCVMNAATRRLFERMDSVAQDHTELPAEEMRGLLAEILCDDTLFEGFCLTFGGDDDLLEQLCDALGCRERLHSLKADPVYQKRKSYLCCLREEAVAAVNLYGVLHVGAFEELVRFYEAFPECGDDFERTAAPYQYTLMAQPKYLCRSLLSCWIDTAVPEVFVTLDGLMMHRCFKADYLSERDALEKFLTSEEKTPDEHQLEGFFERMSEISSFRRLYHAVMDLPLSRLPKAEFLRFANDAYYEVFPEEKRLPDGTASVSWKIIPKNIDK